MPERRRCRFHKINYANSFLSILAGVGRPRKSGTRALSSDPMPSPGRDGHLSNPSGLQSRDPSPGGPPRSGLLPVGPCHSDHRAQARLAPISPAEPHHTRVRPAQIGPEQLRLNQARCQSARHRPPLPSHGHFGVKFMITASWVPPWVAVRDPRSKPFVMTWSVSGTRSNSHSVAARSSGTNIPLASGEGSGGRDHSSDRLF